MGYSESVTKYATQLLQYIGPDGVITGDMTIVQPIMDTISTLVDKDLGTDIEGRLTIGGVSCTSDEQIESLLTEAVEEHTYSTYFPYSQTSYYGTVYETGGRDLAVAIAAACQGVSYDLFEHPSEHWYEVKLSAPNDEQKVLSIKVYEYWAGHDQYPNVVITYGTGENGTLGMLNTVFVAEEHPAATYLNFEVYKGSSGDGVFKGRLDTAPYPEEGEIDYFRTVAIDHYTTWANSSWMPLSGLYDDIGYVQPDVNWDSDNGGHDGGFGIVQMTKGDTETDTWGVVAMGQGGRPLYVGMAQSDLVDVVDDRSYRFAMPEVYGKTYTGDSDAVTLGPVFCPATGHYISRYAKFTVCDMDEISYVMNVGSATYRMESGLCIN